MFTVNDLIQQLTDMVKESPEKGRVPIRIPDLEEGVDYMTEESAQFTYTAKMGIPVLNIGQVNEFYWETKFERKGENR